jgi:hypothetical protein
MSKGYVYILSNPAMPGLVKIGRSIHGGQKRARDIFQTGTPAPFVLEFEILCDDPKEVELEAHNALAKFRVNESREFFSVDLDEAVSAVVAIAARNFSACLISFDECWALSQLTILANKLGMTRESVSDLLPHLSEFSIKQAEEDVRKSHQSYLDDVAAGRRKARGFSF